MFSVASYQCNATVVFAIHSVWFSYFIFHFEFRVKSGGDWWCFCTYVCVWASNSNFVVNMEVCCVTWSTKSNTKLVKNLKYVRPMFVGFKLTWVSISTVNKTGTQTKKKTYLRTNIFSKRVLPLSRVATNWQEEMIYH